LIQALLSLRRFLAKDMIDLSRNTPDGVLNRLCLLCHAFTIA
jgi:hypothetical protein